MEPVEETPVKTQCKDCNVGDVRHFDGLRFSLVITKVETHQVSFDLFYICQFDDSRNARRYRADWKYKQISTENIKDAIAFTSGVIMGDGSSSWDHLAAKDGEIRHRTRSQLLCLGLAMQSCYDWAKEIMPNFNDAF